MYRIKTIFLHRFILSGKYINIRHNIRLLLYVDDCHLTDLKKRTLADVCLLLCGTLPVCHISQLNKLQSCETASVVHYFILSN